MEAFCSEIEDNSHKCLQPEDKKGILLTVLQSLLAGPNSSDHLLPCAQLDPVAEEYVE